MAQKQKSRTTKSPLMQDLAFRLGFRMWLLNLDHCAFDDFVEPDGLEVSAV